MFAFAGERAKTADLEKLAKAKEMEASGKDRTAIWDQTGWFKGVDGKWRFEIDDSQVPVTKRLDERFLSDYPAIAAALPHTDLFRAYPDLTGVRLGIENEASGGSWHSRDGGIVRLRPVRDGDFTPEASRSRKGVALHELQHAVQDNEGMAPGANPGQFYPQIAEARYMEGELRAKLQRMQDAHSDEARAYLRRAAQGDADAARFVEEAQAKWGEKLGRASDDNPFGLAPEQMVAAEIGEADPIFRRAVEQYNDALKTSRLDPEDLYKRSAGEAEARLVQKRADMTPEERAKRPPWLDYDVPEKDQIVRLPDDQGPMFAMRSDLDMSPEARKQRAEQMGFDTSNVWYHGTTMDFDKFDVRKTNTANGVPRAVYLASEPGVANYFSRPSLEGSRVLPLYVKKGKYFDYRNPEDMAKFEKFAMSKTVYDFLPGYLGSPKMENFIKDARDGHYHLFEAPIAQKWLKRNGYEGWYAREPQSNAVTLAVMDPANIRSVNAAFDPAQSSSSNLMFAMRGETETPQRIDTDAITSQLADMAEPLRTALRGLNRSGKDTPSLDLSMGPQGLIAQLTEQADPGSFKILRDDDGLISGVEVRGQTYEVARDQNGAITGLMTSAERAVMEQQEALAGTAADLIARNTGLAPDRAKAIADEAIGIVRESLTDLDGMRTGLAGLVQRTIDEVQNPAGLPMFAMRDAQGRKKPGAEERRAELLNRLKQIEAEYGPEQAKLDPETGEIKTKLQAIRETLLHAKQKETLIDVISAWRDPKNRIDLAKARMLLVESSGDQAVPVADVQNLRQEIVAEKRRMLAQAFWEGRKGAITGDLRRRLNKGVATMYEDMVRVSGGEKVDNPVASAMGAKLAEAFEMDRQRFNAAGGDIAKREKYRFPQYHNPDAVGAVPRETYADFILKNDLLDRSMMVDYATGQPLTDAQLRRIIFDSHGAIKTDGLSRLDDPTESIPGKGAVAKRHREPRIFHFKNADAFLAYNKVYGSGSDIHAAILGHFERMAREIALMEVFGPNPHRMFQELGNFVRAYSPHNRTLPSLVQTVGDAVADYKEKNPKASERVDRLFTQLSEAVTELDNFYAQDRNRIYKKFDGEIAERETAVWGIAGEIERLLSDNAAPANLAATQALRAALDELTTMPGYHVDKDGRIAKWYWRDIGSRTESLIARGDEMFKLVSGATNVPVNIVNARRWQAIRNWTSASTLGMAGFSSFNDHATQMFARGMIGVGANPMRQIVSFFKAAGKGDRQWLLERFGDLDAVQVAFAEAAQAAGRANMATVSGFVADRTHAISSLLSPMTQMQKTGFIRDFARDLGSMMDTAFGGLDERVQRMFKRHGISPGDWDLIRTAEPEMVNGSRMLVPEAIAEKVGRDLAEKYGIMLNRELMHAVVGGTIRGRSFWIGDSRPGTFWGEQKRNFAMIKSYGTAYSTLVLGRIFNEAMAGRGLKPSMVGWGTGLIVAGTMLGAVAMSVKAMLQGKDTPDWGDWKNWGRAYMQGVGLGIFGDFIASSQNRFGGGLAGTIAGPVYGNVLDPLLGLTAGNAIQYNTEEKTNAGAEAVKLLRRNTPGILVPSYLRLAYERVVLDELQKMVDPNAYTSFQRQQQKLRKDLGSEFFWRPGTTEPQRSPQITVRSR